GSKAAWLVLAGFMAVGAGIRHYQNKKGGSPALLLGAMGAMIVAAHLLSSKEKPTNEEGGGGGTAPVAALQGAPTSAAPEVMPASVDLATVGAIKGVVSFSGKLPPAKELAIPGSCPHEGTVYENR